MGRLVGCPCMALWRLGAVMFIPRSWHWPPSQVGVAPEDIWKKTTSWLGSMVVMREDLEQALQGKEQ